MGKRQFQNDIRCLHEKTSNTRCCHGCRRRHRRLPNMSLSDRCSNRAEIFKRPKNREDTSDLDEHLSEWIAAQEAFI